MSEKKAWLEAREHRKTSQYYRKRKRFLQKNRWCQPCLLEDIFTPAQELDHVIPVHKGHDFWDESNWQPICKRCHKIKSDNEKMHQLTKEQQGWKQHIQSVSDETV